MNDNLSRARAVGRRLAFAVALSLPSSSCLVSDVAPVARTVEGVTSKTVLSLPEGGHFSWPIWLNDSGAVVAAYTPPGATHIWDTQLYRIESDHTTVRRIELSTDWWCANTARSNSRLLSDGRIAYLNRCFGHGDPATTTSIWVLDPQTERAAHLLPYFLDANQRWFALAPDLKRGVATDGSGKLVWLSSDKKGEPISLPLERAGIPSWSPDGQWIAFDGVPLGLTTVGASRRDLPEGVYLYAPDRQELKLLFKSVHSMGPSAWSPDGKWFAASIEFVNGDAGVWLVSVATGHYYRVWEGDASGAPMFLPDGRSLLVASSNVATATRSSGAAEIYRLDLPDLNALAGAR